jgi:hypothetical protein
MTRDRRDDTDYERRTLANLVATIALLLVALALTWTVQAMERRRALERCVYSGRLACPAAQAGVAVLSR